MRRIFFIMWWSFLGSSALVAFLQYLQPATFSKAVFPTLIGLACVSGAFAIANKRYE